MIWAGHALLGETMQRAQELNVTPLVDVLLWVPLLIGVGMLIQLMRTSK